MTVHFSDGFETGDFSAWTDTLVNGNDNSIATSSAQAKAGTYSAKVHLENAVAGDYALARKINFASIGNGSHIWASAWWFFPTGFDAQTTIRLFFVQEDGSPWAAICVQLNSSEQLYINDLLNMDQYYQDSPISVPTNQWVGIELHIYVHNTQGYMELWQDGVKIIEKTGIDTLPTNNYAHIRFGAVYVYGDQDTGGTDFYFDEVYIQDEQKIPAKVGPIRFNPFGIRRFGGF